MRRRFRQHALSLLLLLFALSLAGCYTMLRHPDVSDEYAVEDMDEEIVIIDRCGACHPIVHPPVIIPPHRRRDDGTIAPVVRPAWGSKDPVRKNPTDPGIEPLALPPGGGAAGDTRTRETPAETPKETKEIIKKEQTDTGKNPVRRDTDPQKSDDKTKSDDKKKERS